MKKAKTLGQLRLAKVGQNLLAKVGLAKVGLAKVGLAKIGRITMAKVGLAKVGFDPPFGPPTLRAPLFLGSGPHPSAPPLCLLVLLLLLLLCGGCGGRLWDKKKQKRDKNNKNGTKKATCRDKKKRKRDKIKNRHSGQNKKRQTGQTEQTRETKKTTLGQNKKLNSGQKKNDISVWCVLLCGVVLLCCCCAVVCCVLCVLPIFRHSLPLRPTTLFVTALHRTGFRRTPPVCVSVVCVCLLCVSGPRFVCSPDPLPRTAPPLGPLRRTPPPDRPKFRAFFSLSRHIFHSLSLWGGLLVSFFPLSRVLLVEFWWCVGRSGPQMCLFSPSGCPVKPRRPTSIHRPMRSS